MTASLRAWHLHPHQMRPDLPFSLAGRRIWVAGHRGMVGSALVRRLAKENPGEILTVDRATLDLTRQADVEDWMNQNRPEVVFIAAARVGGIVANDSYPVEFLRDNLQMQSNIMVSAAASGVDKLIFLGSSCIYPKFATQPISEDALLTGPLEPTNEWYAIAKIAGLKLAQAYRRQFGRDFVSVMPTNLYGPGDNYDLTSSHVIPALLRKAHEAKRDGQATMTVWGSGKPRREFMHVDDLADAVVFIAKNYSGEQHINAGVGTDITIAELAAIVCRTVGFEGGLEFDISKPDGTPRKMMDSARLAALGWRSSIALEQGLVDAYRDAQFGG